MKSSYPIHAFACLLISATCSSQEPDNSASVSLLAGTINYQGDLNPSSFTFRHSNFMAGVIIRKPLGPFFAIRAGASMGKITAADRWNRDYLKPRNLSYTTTIKEIYAGLEINVIDISTNKFTPYMYGGIAVFHFNPWTRDNSGVKTFLKPLSTEGQGLPQYPEQKPYSLIQPALAFGGGFKFALSDAVTLGIEMSQRKTFTDYLDDVSSHYVDESVLLQAKGAKAVELAYRGDEVAVGSPVYPAHGMQRGTPSEMDWYYYAGMTLEIKLYKAGEMFKSYKSVAGMRCPRVPLY